MLKVLLISNRVMHYRSKIYNGFYDLFKDINMEFHVVSNDYQMVDFPIKYVKHEVPFGFKAYSDFIEELSPDICIFFLHLRDKMFIPLLHWCRFHGQKVIYWGHGANLDYPDSLFRRILFNHIHSHCDSIILYSPDQIRYIAPRNRNKIFIANNTLCFDSSAITELSTPEQVKKIYGIKEKKTILFISRILPHKGLDILLKLFRDTPHIGLVIVGPGINENQLNIVNETSHYYYLGEKYEKEVDELYQAGDVFSTPGHIGLALVQAMYWSKPVIVLNRIHAPEIVYLHNGENGFIVDNEKELKETILRLCENDDYYKMISDNARKTYEKEMKLSVMFKGFKDAIDFAIDKNNK